MADRIFGLRPEPVPRTEAVKRESGGDEPPSNWLGAFGYKDEAESTRAAGDGQVPDRVRLPQPVHGFERSDAGNADRFAAQHREKFRFVPGLGWLEWTGKKWRATGKDALPVMAAAELTAKSILTEAAAYLGEDQSRLAKWAISSQSAARIDAVLKLARHKLAASIDELDSDPWLLNTQSGVMNLRTGVLQPHDRDDLCTRITRAKFDPDATAPRWEQFLREALPDEEVRAFVHRWAGSLLTGDTSDHVVFIAIGTGRNGKGILFNTLAHVLGDYARSVSQQFFLRRPGDPPPKAELAQLPGIRFIFGTELKKKFPLDVEFIKGMSGGDPVVGEAKYQPPFEFIPSFKIAMSANQRPQAGDTTDSFWARARWVLFPNNFQALGTLDKDLPKKLKAEADGILAWAVSGCASWQTNGLGSAQAIDQFGAEERAAQDPLSSFFEEETLKDPGATCGKRDLFARYQTWASNGADHLPKGSFTERSFNREMRDRGFAESKNSQTRRAQWVGICLRDSPSQTRMGEGF